MQDREIEDKSIHLVKPEIAITPHAACRTALREAIKLARADEKSKWLKRKSCGHTVAENNIGDEGTFDCQTCHDLKTVQLLQVRDWKRLCKEHDDEKMWKSLSLKNNCVICEGMTRCEGCNEDIQKARDEEQEKFRKLAKEVDPLIRGMREHDREQATQLVQQVITSARLQEREKLQNENRTLRMALAGKLTIPKVNELLGQQTLLSNAQFEAFVRAARAAHKLVTIHPRPNDEKEFPLHEEVRKLCLEALRGLEGPPPTGKVLFTADSAWCDVCQDPVKLKNWYLHERKKHKDHFSTHCPQCHTKLKHGSGIGLYCPNKKCDVIDGPGRFMIREDGRLERFCDHAIGHTVYAPKGSDYVHGCDGCCKSFKRAPAPKKGGKHGLEAYPL